MLLTILYVVHTLALGGWFGTQIYSVLFVQRHPAKDEDPEYYEVFTTRMVNGSRYILLAVIAAMIPTWIAIVAMRAGDPELGSAWGWLVAVKSVAMVLAIGSFAYLSWHVWPQRIFALPAELPAVRRRFYGLSVGILACMAGAFMLGVIEQAMGSILT